MVLAQGNVGINAPAPNVTLAIGDNNSGLQQNAENVLSIVTNNLNRITILENGNVGINNFTPTKRLDVDANNQFIKIRNLKPVTSNQPYFLIYNKTNGEVSKTEIIIKAGQILRAPLVSNNYNENSNNFAEFNTNGSAIPAPSGLAAFPNYINTISEDLATFPVTVSSNTINNIPPGTYKITLKLCGGFTSNFPNDNQGVSVGMTVSTDNIIFNDYSYSEGIISNYSNTPNTDKTGYYTDIIKLTAPNNFLKFKLNVNINKFEMEFPFNNAYRNILTLERL
jgi:hypothetical protein